MQTRGHTKNLVLLYSWVASNFQVLVPKRRGVGYLAVPYGHHPIPGLDKVADLLRVDVTGLDGALCFECGGKVFHGGEVARSAFASIIVPALEAHYGMTSREIDAGEFWAAHPSTDNRAWSMSERNTAHCDVDSTSIRGNP